MENPTVKEEIDFSETWNDDTDASNDCEVMSDAAPEVEAQSPFDPLGIENNLEAFMTLNKESKLFACNLCLKTFADKKNVEPHLYSHTGERLYGCEVCPKSLDSLIKLKHHYDRCHPQESFPKDKDFPLPFYAKYFCCGKCSIQIKGLIPTLKHLQSNHLEDLRQSLPEKCQEIFSVFCDYCDFGCNKNCDLTTHMKRKHAEKPQASLMYTIDDEPTQSLSNCQESIEENEAMETFQKDETIEGIEININCTDKYSKESSEVGHESIEIHRLPDPDSQDMSEVEAEETPFDPFENSQSVEVPSEEIVTDNQAEDMEVGEEDTKSQSENTQQENIVNENHSKVIDQKDTKINENPLPFWPFKCNMCLRIFPLENSFTAHICTERKKVYPCEICAKKCIDKDHLKTHMTSKHASLEKPKENPVKKIKSESSPKVITRIPKPKLPKEPKPYILPQCVFCQKKFQYRSGLLPHLYEHTGESPFTCEVCDKGYPSKKGLQNHYAKNHPSVQFPEKLSMEDPHTKWLKCKYCTEKLYGVSGLLEHYQHCQPDTDDEEETETEEQHQCVFCPNKFRYRFKLIPHLYEHFGEKPFNCEVCYKDFYTKKSLRVHYEKAHGSLKCPKDLSIMDPEQKWLKCKFCFEEMFGVSGLLEHYKSVHPDSHEANGRPIEFEPNKPSDLGDFKCDLCHQSHVVFLSLAELESHKRTKHNTSSSKVVWL